MTNNTALFIYRDGKAGADILEWRITSAQRGPRYRPLSVRRYRQDVSVNVAKGLRLPHLRGTWLPCFDKQAGFGVAVNWLGIRIRVDLLR